MVMPALLTVLAALIASTAPLPTVCSPSVSSMITLRGDVLVTVDGRILSASNKPFEIAVVPLAGPYLLIAASIAAGELLMLTRTRDLALKSTILTIELPPLPLPGGLGLGGGGRLP